MTPASLSLLALSVLLTDFDEEGIPLDWRSVNDDVMGGRSRGTFRVADGVLEFSGSLNTDGGGFASVRTRPRALGLDGHAGMRLRVRGDGRTYALTLRQDDREGRRGVSYRAEFTAPAGDAWHDVRLPFASFVPMWRGRRLDRPPVDPARVESLGFLIADGTDGPFRLRVDAIRAYRPFSMEALRWNARPLLVFAPSGDDARVVEQVAAVEASLDAFRDRDMVLLVVPGDGHRPLDVDEAAALRERFDVPAGTFALLLVGKDGGVKFRARDFVDPQVLYDRIDAMPMRRAEMRDD